MVYMYTNMIVLQSAVNEATFEVLCIALMVTKSQLSLGFNFWLSPRFSIFGDS